MDIILAVDKNGGMGLGSVLPWCIPQEANIFRDKTINNILIMGRTTVENLPYLEYRTIICLSKTMKNTHSEIASATATGWKNNVIICGSFDDAIKKCDEINNSLYVKKKVFVAGGLEIYKLAFENYKHLINSVHISIINREYTADKYFDMEYLDDFIMKNMVKNDIFTHKEMIKPNENL